MLTEDGPENRALMYFAKSHLCHFSSCLLTSLPNNSYSSAVALKLFIVAIFTTLNKYCNAG